MEIRITLPCPPSANDTWRHNRGRVHLSEEAVRFRQTVARQCAAAGVRPFIGAVRLCVTAHTRDGRDIGANILKALEDSLNGWGWLDDGQIEHACCDWVRAEDRRQHVEVVIDGQHRATREEAEAWRARKAASAQKRKATLARNRRGPKAGPLPPNVLRLSPAYVRPPPLECHAHTCGLLRGKAAACTCRNTGVP